MRYHWRRFALIVFLSLLVEERLSLQADHRVLILGYLVIFVSQAMLAVPKRKGAKFNPSENLVFCGFISGEGIETGVFVDLVHLFDIWITLLF